MGELSLVRNQGSPKILVLEGRVSNESLSEPGYQSTGGKTLISFGEAELIGLSAGTYQIAVDGRFKYTGHSQADNYAALDLQMTRHNGIVNVEKSCRLYRCGGIKTTTEDVEAALSFLLNILPIWNANDSLSICPLTKISLHIQNYSYVTLSEINFTMKLYRIREDT